MKEKIGFLSVGIAILILLAGTSPAIGSIDTKQIEVNQTPMEEIPDDMKDLLERYEDCLDKYSPNENPEYFY